MAKFEDALPFYRQSKQFARMGIELPRASLCN
jgi:transposase